MLAIRSAFYSSLPTETVPMTNLNTLLSQPLGATSPTGVPDGQHPSSLGRPPTQFLTGNRALLVATSPDASTGHPAGFLSGEIHPARLGLPSASLDGRLPYGFAGSQARNFGASSIYANLQVLASELEKISDRAMQDSSFARRASRAINEVCLFF